jgi:hypothetical protein
MAISTLESTSPPMKALVLPKPKAWKGQEHNATSNSQPKQPSFGLRFMTDPAAPLLQPT